MRELKFYNNEPWLRKKYFGDKLSTREMGALVGVNGATIRKFMERRNIKMRTRSEAWELSTGSPPYRKELWLRKQYWRRGKSLREIALPLGCTASTIKYWMKKRDVPRRSSEELDEGRARRECPSLFGRFRAWLGNIITSLDLYMREKDN